MPNPFERFRETVRDNVRKTSIQLYAEVWQGWDEQDSNLESGISAFLAPMEKSLDVINDEVNQALKEDIYRSHGF